MGSKDAMRHERIARRGFGVRLAGGAYLFALIGFVWALTMPPARASTIAMGEISAIPGQSQLALPFSLTVAPGEQISALMVDAHFDTSLIDWKSIRLAPEVLVLGKAIETRLVADGHVRLVIYGVNQEIFTSGVLGEFIINILPEAQPGMAAMTLNDGSSVSPDGSELPVNVTDGRIWIDTPQDVIAPRITDVSIVNLSSTAATLAWLTDEIARTSLDIGTSTLYGITKDGESDFTATHQVDISGLAPNTTYHFRISALDEAGNSGKSSDRLFTTPPLPDTLAPSLVLTSPIWGAQVLLGESVQVSGVAIDDRDAGLSVLVNGTPVSLTRDGSFTHQIPTAVIGELSIHIEAVDAAGNRVEMTRVLNVVEPPDVTAPVLKVTSPLEAAQYVQGEMLIVAGQAQDDRSDVIVTINGSSVAVGSDGSFSRSILDLTAGQQTFTVIATDTAGNATTTQRSVSIIKPQAKPPTVRILAPQANSAVIGASTYITFKVEHVTMRVGGVHLALFLDNEHAHYLYSLRPYGWHGLTSGAHTISLRVVDANHVPFSNPEAHASITFTVELNEPPPPVHEPSVRVISAHDGGIVGRNSALRVEVKDATISRREAHLRFQLDWNRPQHIYNTKPFYLRNLSLGAHRMKIRLVDRHHRRIPGPNTEVVVYFMVK